MFENRFTESAQNAINLAAESAMELGHNYVGTEHMLLGLIKRRRRCCRKDFRVQ